MKKIILTIICLLLVFSAVACGVIVANGMIQPFNPALTDDGVEIKTDTAYGDRINVLILGADEGGARSDSILLASVDTKNKKLAFLSIPRDTRVLINGKYDKVNHALGYREHEEASIKAVKTITGMPIHYYVSFELAGFRAMIDMLGGVYMDVPQDMKYSDPYQNLYIDLKKGYQLLDGNKAEQLVRYRKGYAEGDLGRVKAQQLFVRELIKQKLTLDNIGKAKDMFAIAKKYVKTNYGVKDLLGHLDLMKGIDTSDVYQEQVPGVPQMISGISYYIYDEVAIKKLVAEHFGGSGQ